MGGFYHNYVPSSISTIDGQEFDVSHINIDWHPFWSPIGYERALDQLEQGKYDWRNDNTVYNSFEYSVRMSAKQLVVFKDEHNTKDMYHIKERYTDNGLEELGEFAISFNDLESRGSLQTLLTKVSLPPRLESLPMAYDYMKLHFYVIINQKDSNDMPRLYYNSFKYKNFTENWKYVDIPKGYRYNAFIPLQYGVDFDLFRESPYKFHFRVIAEPFRDTKTDKSRGPSFLFALERDNKTGIPSLKKLVIN